MIEITCCETEKLSAPETAVGKKIRCPACGRVLQIVSGEALADGAGTGDFDAALDLQAGPKLSASRFLLGGVKDIEIGKLASCPIVLPGEMVSRRHCRLVRIDFGPPRWKIVDQNSTNGLIVNGQRISELELSDGDLIEIGEYTLRYTVEGWTETTFSSFNQSIGANAEPPAIPTANYASASPGVSNGMAIAGLILGILLCFPLCNLLAVVFSGIGLWRARKRNGAGKSPAIAGLVLGLVGLVFVTPTFYLLLIPLVDRAHEAVNQVKCRNNMVLIGNALAAYAHSNGGAFPTNLNDLVSRGLLSPQALVCPDAPIGSGSNYILSATNLNVPPSTIILYEPLSNHGNGINVLYRDGRVVFLPQQQAMNAIAQLQNQPNGPSQNGPFQTLGIPSPPAMPQSQFFAPHVPTFSPPPTYFPSHPSAPMPPRNSGPVFSDVIPDDATKTEMIGGNGGGPYVRVNGDKQRVIGFAIQIGNWSNHPTLGHCDPLFSRDTSAEPSQYTICLAKPGYAVGGIIVNKLDGADGLQIIFMRIKGDGLDVHD